MKAQVTRTTGPLHFEDLDPHRFEDLVRQLVYDFKPWRKLEPTGRTGGDEGFDVRGYEIIASDESSPRDPDDEDAPEAGQTDRLWLIQCKREKSITPKKLRDYLDTIPAETRSSLYGVVFAAACDFSIKARDTLNEWARDNGIAEAHQWGKADLEDQLVQPKNDHLLFGFFGVSLQIRKRSVRTALRARLTMKKRVEAIFGKEYHSNVLLRDPTDDRYPNTGDPADNHRGKWQVTAFGRIHALGILVQYKRHFAWVSNDASQWDVIDNLDVGRPSRSENPWASEEGKEHRDLHARAFDYWGRLPDTNRANYYEEQLIRYEDIVAIDEAGDEYAECPHIYIDFDLRTATLTSLKPLSQWSSRIDEPDPAARIAFFPKQLPDPQPYEAETPSDGLDERLKRDPK